jgi:hypothetical protein
MSGMSIGLVMFAVLLVLLALRVHIGIAMFIIGSAGFLVMNDYQSLPLLATLKNIAYARFSNYDLAVIPLFSSRRMVVCRARCSIASTALWGIGVVAWQWPRSVHALHSAQSAARRSLPLPLWGRWHSLSYVVITMRGRSQLVRSRRVAHSAS